MNGFSAEIIQRYTVGWPETTGNHDFEAAVLAAIPELQPGRGYPARYPVHCQTARSMHHPHGLSSSPAMALVEFLILQGRPVIHQQAFKLPDARNQNGDVVGSQSR